MFVFAADVAQELYIDEAGAVSVAGRPLISGGAVVDGKLSFVVPLKGTCSADFGTWLGASVKAGKIGVVRAETIEELSSAPFEPLTSADVVDGEVRVSFAPTGAASQFMKIVVKE